MSNPNRIVELALAARTGVEAGEVQQLIERAVGSRHERPIGNTWNNQGVLTGSGSSYDHKALEVVTNMQDAVLELLAIDKFGSRGGVPYRSPHEAAAALLSGTTSAEKAEFTNVTIDPAGPGADKKRITLVMRDQGCGISAEDVPTSIFRVGSKHKDGYDWQQGTFGLGGATTYRNSQAVVLVSRRHPNLLRPGESDQITVAVVQWERQRTTVNAFYLVTRHWDEDDPSTWAKAVPFTVAASEYPDFQPGTHLALIAYDTEGLGRRSGDERSFDTVLNTRLFNPVIPIRYRNNITRPDRLETLDGLKRRLMDNPGPAGSEGQDRLPFNHHGTTYQLPIWFRLFAKPGEKGQRRNFVAHGHALLITSNGQVHSHWTPQDFKLRTKLNKLHDRVLIVVESDALPIDVRTELFTADRAQLVRSAAAMRLEKEISAFLNEWAALDHANRELIRDAITGDNNTRPTIAIAEKIARALKLKGFSFGASSAGKQGGGRQKPPEPSSPEDLYDDPTRFEGPLAVHAPTDRSKGIYFKLNAKDGFLGSRGDLIVTCSHPDIGPDEITVGELNSGRVRVSIAVPASAEIGSYTLHAEIPAWCRSSGGLGSRFEWTTQFHVMDEETIKTKETSSKTNSGKHDASEGGLVALIWRADLEDNSDDWTPATVGQVEMVSGKDLASQREEYKSLSKVSDEIPTVVLNRTYSPLKAYIQARAAEISDESKEQARERYAVGIGVALLLLDQETQKAKKQGKSVDEGILAASQQAAARAVLSVLPEFDRIAKEIED